MGFEFQAGSIFADFQIDPTKFQAGMAQLVGQAQAYAQQMQGAFSRAMATVPGKDQAQKNVVGFVETVRGAFAHVGSAITSLAAPFVWLEGKILNLKTALVGFAGYQFFNRAAEVEAMAVGFTTLTTSIGVASDSLLRRLREAVRGSVSDMELMRLTNRAVQLDLVKSEDQFVRLADAAHEIGEATGVDAAQALERFILALGYGNERALRELNINVDQAKALADYSLQFGKFGDKLTETEKKAAFFNTVMGAVGEKVKTLSGGSPLLLKGFEQLKTSITNTIDAVGIAVSGPFSRIAKSIADFLNVNRERIASFSREVGDYIDGLFARVRQVFDRWGAGKLSIGGLFGDLAGLVIEEISKIVNIAVDALRGSLDDVLWHVDNVIFDFFQKVQPRLEQHFEDMWDRFNLWINDKILSWVPFANLAAEDWVEAAKKRIEERIEERDRAKIGPEPNLNLPGEPFGPAPNPFARKVAAGVAVAAEPRVWLQEELEATRRWVGASKTLLVDLWDKVAAGATFAGEKARAALDAVAQFAKNIFGWSRGRLPSAAAFANSPEIVGTLGELAKAAEEADKKLTGGEGAPGGTEAERRLDAFVKKIEEYHRRFGDLGSVAEANIARWLDTLRRGVNLEAIEKLQEALAQSRDGVSQLRTEIETLDSGEVAARINELGREFDKLTGKFAGNLTPAVEAARQALLESFSERKMEVIALGFAKVGKSIEEMNRSLDKSIAQATMTELEKAIDDVNRQVDEQYRNLPAAGGLADARRYVELEEKRQQLIAKVREDYELKQNVAFSKEVSGALLGGLADGFMRGERLGKAWCTAVGDMFKQQLSKAITAVSDWAATTIGSALGALGRQMGLGGGMGALGTGLLAIGAIIWQTAQASKSATIEDFTNAVNSSEAVRGVVAGPTNIAISKVGENLRTALIPTDNILIQILEVLRSGKGGTITVSPSGGRSLGSTMPTV